MHHHLKRNLENELRPRGTLRSIDQHKIEASFLVPGELCQKKRD